MDGVRDLPGGLVVQTTCCQCRGLRLNPWSGTKNWCFWAVELEKTLESPLDCKEIKPVNPKGNQSWIFTEELMLNPKLHYFGHLMWRANSLEKTLMLGEIEGRREGDDRGWDGWMASPTQWTWVWVNSSSWWWTGRPGVLKSMGSQRIRHKWATELNWRYFCHFCLFISISDTSLLQYFWLKTFSCPSLVSDVSLGDMIVILNRKLMLLLLPPSS